MTNNTLGERMIQRLGGITTDELQQRLDIIMEENGQRAKLAYRTGWEDGLSEARAPVSGEDETGFVYPDGGVGAYGWRRTTATKRDLSGYSQEKAIEAAYRLWNTQPLMKALTEILVDYTIGEGIQFVSEFPEVQEVLLDFVEDPVNKLTTSGLEWFARELSLYGEQLFPVFVNTGEDIGGVGTGLVRLGAVDPSDIDSIITVKGNMREMVAVKLKDVDGEKGKIYKIIRQQRRNLPLESNQSFAEYKQLVDEAGDENRMLEAAEIQQVLYQRLPASYDEWVVCGTGKDQGTAQLQLREQMSDSVEQERPVYDGAAFLFQVNKMSTGLRGRPDYLTQFDWLDRFDQLFFDAAEHVSVLNIFGWHLIIEGGSENSPDPETNLKRQMRKLQDLKSNSVVATNEKAKIEPKNPDLRTADIETIIRQLRNFISGGARVPEHWVSEGGYTNRATAEEMGQPTYRMLAKRQNETKRFLRQMCQFQLDVLVALGKLDPEFQKTDDKTEEEIGDPIPTRDAFEIVMPDINISDTKQAAISFELVSRAITLLRTQGLLPDEQALEILKVMLELLAIDLDVQEVLAMMEPKLLAQPMSSEELGLDKQIGDITPEGGPEG